MKNKKFLNGFYMLFVFVFALLILGIAFQPQAEARAVVYCTVPAGSNIYQKVNSVDPIAVTVADVVAQNKGDALGRTSILIDPTGPEIIQAWTDEASCP